MKEVARNTRRFKRTGTFVSPLAQVVRTTVLGEPIFFSVENPDDVIQSQHITGAFYEPEELAIIARYFPQGGRFCDVGANVGNHSLYVAKFLHAEICALIEPNPPAIALLESNIFLNGIQNQCDRRYLGMGLSDGQVSTASMKTRRSNLGASRVKEGAGDIEIRTFDELFADVPFSLVKIDVEGMEIKVLNGAEEYLKAHRPHIFIEVDEENYDQFDAWVAAHGYQKVETFKRYARNTNFMLAPI